MLKKILISITMIFIIISCIGCAASGNNNIDFGKSKKSVSKIDGDYVFYSKNNESYYMNVKNMEETRYYPEEVFNIWIDEERNQFIFTSRNNKIARKKLNKNEDAIIIDEGTVEDIIDNDYILYSNGYDFFYYDLNNEKKELLTEEFAGRIYVKNNLLTFIERAISKDGKYNLIAYDLKNKTKKTSVIKTDYITNTEHISNYSNYILGNGEFVYVKTDKSNDDIRTDTLYRVVAGKEQATLDSITSEKHPYIAYSDKKLKDANAFLNINFQYSEGIIYYSKETEWGDLVNGDNGSTKWQTKISRYMIHPDGRKEEVEKGSYSVKKLEELEDQKNSVNNYMTVLKCKQNGINKFIFNDKEYEGYISAIASDLSRAYFSIGEKSNTKYYTIDFSNNEINEVENLGDNYGIYYFDKNYLLGLKYSGNLCLNDIVIDYNVHGNKDIIANEDCSKILYNNNAGVNIYSNGNTTTFSSEIRDYALTNNFNLYYTKRDGGVFVNIDGEELQLVDYDYLKLNRYKLLNR